MFCKILDILPVFSINPLIQKQSFNIPSLFISRWFISITSAEIGSNLYILHICRTSPMKKSQQFLIKKPAVTLGFVECQDLPLFFYSWTIPNISCSDVFVSIDAYDYNGYYTAAEGSEDRFVITPVGIDENNKPGRFLSFNLAQNYPDPVWSKTTIKYSLPRKCKVVLELFDVSGRKVMVLVDEYQKSGCYQVRLDIDKSSLANGIYFYRLRADNSTATKKLVVCR
jgi:hypothetical protein